MARTEQAIKHRDNCPGKRRLCPACHCAAHTTIADRRTLLNHLYGYHGEFLAARWDDPEGGHRDLHALDGLPT